MLQGVSGQQLIGTDQALGYVVATLAPGDPLRQRHVLHPRPRLEHLQPALVLQHQPHVAVTRVGGLLHRQALRRARLVEDDVALLHLGQRHRLGQAGEQAEDEK